MIPNQPVVRIAEANVLDVGRLVAGLLQPHRQGRRKLGVDQEFHLAGDTTA
jgi:hypothetical protein